MYEVKVTGSSLEDLRTNFRNINNVFNNDSIIMTEIGNDKVVDCPEVPPVIVADEALDPVAPEAVTVEAPVQVNEGEVDSENCPWDRRIHTSKHTKNKLGDWKLKRGVDKNYVAKIKNSIRLQSAPVQVAQAPVETVAPVQVAQAPIVPTFPVETAPVQVAQAPVETAPVETAQVAQAPIVPTFPGTGGHTVESFSINFAMILANLINSKKINQKYIEDLKVYFNTSEIWDINEPQKAELFESFASYGFITKM